MIPSDLVRLPIWFGRAIQLVSIRVTFKTDATHLKPIFEYVLYTLISIIIFELCKSIRKREKY